MAMEPSRLSGLTTPYCLVAPDVQRVPLVLASPHSGHDYPADFMASARLDRAMLRRSEDSFVDELFGSAPELGVPLLAAKFPRAVCDPNREPWELDPSMFEEPLPHWVNTSSARVGAGLGTIARVIASGEPIYRGKLRFAEAQDRVRRLWQPFHNELQRLVAETQQRFGVCYLIDCHSMPAAVQQPRGTVDIVLGDAYGTACSPRFVRRVESLLAQMGYRVRRNDPYAGGYITRHYGQPRQGVLALQIEICRSLYMDEVNLERLPRFAEVRTDMTRLIAGLPGD